MLITAGAECINMQFIDRQQQLIDNKTLQKNSRREVAGQQCTLPASVTNQPRTHC